jgi:hypothetical protein
MLRYDGQIIIVVSFASFATLKVVVLSRCKDAIAICDVDMGEINTNGYMVLAIYTSWVGLW